MINKSTSFLYKYTATILACIILLSSTAFAVDMHFCKGVLKSVNVLGTAESCHKVSNAANTTTHTCKAANAKSACCAAKKVNHQNFSFEQTNPCCTNHQIISTNTNVLLPATIAHFSALKLSILADYIQLSLFKHFNYWFAPILSPNSNAPPIVALRLNSGLRYQAFVQSFLF